ncbi:MAG: sensor histidine kinase, partial [Chloroflexota bacterium]
QDLTEATERFVTFVPEPTVERVDCDPRVIRYVVSNLVTNAVKYSPPDTKVLCEAWADPAAGEIYIRVSDEGIGIPEVDMENVAEPFFRGSNIGTVGGTGLGLSIIQTIAAAHNGRIMIESEEGVGTVVTVTLRIASPTVEVGEP